MAGLICVILALGVAAFGLSSLFSIHVERRAEAELTTHFDQILAGLTLADGYVTVGGQLSDPRFGRPYGGLYWQIERMSQTGEPVAQSRSRSMWDDTLPVASSVDGPAFLRLPGPQSEALLARVQRIDLPAALGGGIAQITVAMNAQSIDAARRSFMHDMLPYLVILGAVLIGAGVLQITLGLRPLRHLQDRVGRLRKGSAARMGTGWPQEVRPLTLEVDALLDQHEQEVQKAHNRAADLAHGLKTPLQALLGEAGRLRSEGSPDAARSLEDLAVRMRRQVDFELARTRFDAGLMDAGADLRKVADGVLSVLKRTPEAANLELRNDIDEGAGVAMQPEELAELIGALTENAVRYARSKVILHSGTGNPLQLIICDDGPGMQADRRSKLMTRGARLDESGEGTGLGLAIAQDIVKRRGGTLHLADLETGGLRVICTLLPHSTVN